MSFLGMIERQSKASIKQSTDLIMTYSFSTFFPEADCYSVFFFFFLYHIGCCMCHRKYLTEEGNAVWSFPNSYHHGNFYGYHHTWKD